MTLLEKTCKNCGKEFCSFDKNHLVCSPCHYKAQLSFMVFRQFLEFEKPLEEIEKEYEKKLFNINVKKDEKKNIEKQIEIKLDELYKKKERMKNDIKAKNKIKKEDFTREELESSLRHKIKFFISRPGIYSPSMYNFLNFRLNDSDRITSKIKNFGKRNLFFRILTGSNNKIDDFLMILWKEINILAEKIVTITSDIDYDNSTIKDYRKIKREYIKSCKIQELYIQRINEKRDKKEKFVNNCHNEMWKKFDREKYIIRKKDYRRGNRLDNFIRNNFYNNVLKSFENKCVVCGSENDLTFDHFSISKNEGGNFILLCCKNENFIKINLVLLCRECNSSKGETRAEDFFPKNILNKIHVYQKNLLQKILKSEECFKVFREWYKI
ncbi:MAG: HNH endonuclease [Candidatus Hodarchaeales archaeon]|jgi:5-methylcytosine-specific restriction endonuclease McrA